MNTQTVNDMSPQSLGRSMNSYLQHQSLKSRTLFDSNDQLPDGFNDQFPEGFDGGDQQQAWLRMEKRLQDTRERIEKAALAVKLASANVAQFDDDTAPPDTATVRLAFR